MDTASFIGVRASVKTSLGETHEGVIFTYDPTSSALVLEQRKGADPKATYRIIKTSVVREIVVLQGVEPAAEDAPEKLPLPDVNMAAVRAREERAVARAKEDLAHVNPSVTVRAQSIYDALRKTMPCEWREKDNDHYVLVLNEVLVSPPYTPDLCKGKPGPTLTRVQKVLAGELEKLKREVPAN
ncbi:hypothetical protein AB1Y20_022472 [Prymnesium parvum]|uniref:AD domain-containing protein n=1 Tax=Prymnesium parvum TaxID=97485 RepID=A0AB34JJH7_PRYPA